LQLLYCAGWVHRDISEGNILAHRNDLKNSSTPWKAKLMDLEYARKFPPPDNYEAAVDPKTGTPYFMPTEILAMEYLYQPIEEVEIMGRSKYTANTNAPSRDIVIHNFQHDLESLWWLILYLIISHIKDQPIEDWQNSVFKDAVERCKNWAAPIFQNVIGLSAGRRFCFKYSLMKATESFIPENVAPVVNALEVNRRTLLRSFMVRVKDGNLRNIDSYAHIHLDFGELLEEIQALRVNWRQFSLKTSEKTSIVKKTLPTAAPAAVTATSAAAVALAPPGKVKAKREPDQNPNLEEQGRAGGSQAGGKKSRHGR
ncbi:hypothetical protein CVT25_002362, partial [Psilocybe cyanescens]